MWRTSEERTESAERRLGLAFALWGWTPHEKQRLLFTSPSQVTVVACGRRWGKSRRACCLAPSFISCDPW